MSPDLFNRERGTRMPDNVIASLRQAQQGDLQHLREYPMADKVNNPAHYNSHPSGVECITITEHMGFNLGNAVKYIWRADLKNDAIEDLRKARWYIEREIAKRLKASEPVENE